MVSGQHGKCSECGDYIGIDDYFDGDMFQCEICGNMFCMRCARSCAVCGEGICPECDEGVVCEDCGESVCENCFKKCPICEEYFCTDCLTDEVDENNKRICKSCAKKREEHE